MSVKNEPSASGNILTVKPAKSLISILEDNREVADTSLNSRQITRTEPLLEKLIVALRENYQEQVSSIIELMAILVETNNTKMLKFLHKNNILDIMQKQKSDQYPRFYCSCFINANICSLS